MRMMRSVFLLLSSHLVAGVGASLLPITYSTFLTHLLPTITFFNFQVITAEDELPGNLIYQSFLLPNGEEELKWDSCNDSTLLQWEDIFDEVHVDNSLYQEITFDENLESNDKCLTLDTTMQQCTTYRPHYHEPFVHYSASYLNKGIMSGVKRVVFVGGGDSMLLHEVLKYKDLEIVLGLELDQKVTR